MVNSSISILITQTISITLTISASGLYAADKRAKANTVVFRIKPTYIDIFIDKSLKGVEFEYRCRHNLV